MQEQLLWRRVYNPGSKFWGMDASESTGQIIKAERERRGWSQDRLAEEAGISQEAVLKIEKGKTKKSRYLPRIAEVLELPLARLDKTLTEVARGVSRAAADVAYGPRDFPIHGSVEGGPGQIVIGQEPVDYVERPSIVARASGAYGLLVTGASMEPEYRIGDMAIVHPGLPHVSDEVYIFYSEQDGEVRTTIKYLRRATSDKWFVSQHNPAEGMQKDFALSRKEWGRADRVVGKYRRR